MAAHAHTLIRNAVAAALAGLATTAARVYPNRLHPMDDANLPGLRVFTDQCATEHIDVHRPATQEHRLQLAVECCARANTGLDDTCDAMQKEVEVALYAGISVGGKTVYPALQSSQYDDEPAGTNAGVKRVEFEILYFTLSNAPDVLI